ncbi:MAG: hypothetical protein KHX03_06095 [Clostridium sp.]|nr:hypothetical protein [Clostridium sp.]
MMFDFKLFLDPVILAILVLFTGVIIYYVKKVLYINKSLTSLTNVLKSFKKGNIAYRFKELDEIFSRTPFLSNYWVEFKNTLVFNDGMISANETSNIQCTVDSGFFFNEETLVNSKLNYKFISAVPTILTGLGPLFTFLHISLAFSKVNFATQEATIASVSSLLAAMKVAAMISVVAVGSSILFMIIERILYKNLCITPLSAFQLELNKLFDNITSEKFLVELLRESKLQNNSLNQAFETLPAQMKTAFDKSFKESLVPYLDNLIFSVNKLQENLNKKGSKGILDDLFGNSDEE